jgi:hypothetical protein
VRVPRKPPRRFMLLQAKAAGAAGCAPPSAARMAAACDHIATPARKSTIHLAIQVLFVTNQHHDYKESRRLDGRPF